MRIFRSAPFYYWLVIGVFLMIYAGFAIVYFEKKAEYQNLQVQIAPNRLLLQKPGPDLGKLEQQLSQAEAEIKTQWAYLPVPGEGYRALQ